LQGISCFIPGKGGVVAYQINNGVVINDALPVPPEQLYKEGKIQVLSGSEELTLVSSKRPAELKFHFNLDHNPHFTLSFRGELLQENQMYSLTNQGYFIADSNRIHFVNPTIRDYVSAAYGELHIAALMKLLRALYQEDLCEQLPSNILENLRTQQSSKAKHEKLFEKTLYPYQSQGVDWLSFCTESGVGTILADDMGLGKTAQIIALCCDTLEKNSSARILIVVPNPLLDNWVREFAFFAPNVQPYLHYGSSRRGISSAIENNNIIITPYTTMTSDISMLEDMTFDLAVFDEASMLKNPNSGRSIAARQLDVLVSVAMTGTPVENNLMDAWSLCDLVFPGFMGSQEDFKSRYVHKDLSDTLNSDLEDLEASLRQITMRRMKKDVLEQLPEKLDIHIPVTLTENERKGYERIIEEMQCTDGNNSSGILPLINKLQQFSAHPALIDNSIPTNANSLSKHSSKFELMMMKVKGIAQADEKVIIFATFQKVIDLVKSAIKEKFGIDAGIIDGRTPNEERQPLIDQFSSSVGFDVLILHPKTAGMGLNITAASNVIHYCRQWNPALEEQATARAWRNGQRSVVNVFYMYYADTIEEVIDERIRLKQQLSDRVVSVADNKETDKQIMLEYLEKLAK